MYIGETMVTCPKQKQLAVIFGNEPITTTLDIRAPRAQTVCVVTFRGQFLVNAGT